MGDPELLAQLLLNLALNGLQAMSPAGKGRLSFGIGTRREGNKEFVRFRVANDGPAVPADRLERIFDPFYTTKDDGTGLGLSICSRIADQHDGILEVSNLPAGSGVEFALTLEGMDGSTVEAGKRGGV
jgi:signal transduction histidine kinase